MSSYRTYTSHNQRSAGRSRGSSNNRNSGRRTSQYINPARFIKAARNVTAEPYIATHKFSDFDIQPILQTNLIAMGYDTPSPIQDQTIPPALLGKDVIGVADTGTGKTAAFAVPLLNKLLNEPGSRALIIAPTRELAQQIEAECRSIAKNSRLRGAQLIGGTSIMPQLRDLRSNPQIVTGTPGRIKDHLERRSLSLANFNLVVLDEVDRMLDMGFVNDVREILSQLSSHHQSFFFSATVGAQVQDLIKTFSNDPVTVSIKTGDTCDNVAQDVVGYSTAHDKLDKLHDILINDPIKAIVFDETQRRVEQLSKELVARGFKADAIHGGKSQGQRQRALQRFKSNQVNVLVATDVAARGIDVIDITHVINYSQPQTYNDYIHRVGRAGRAGRSGQALTFVSH